MNISAYRGSALYVARSTHSLTRASESRQGSHHHAAALAGGTATKPAAHDNRKLPYRGAEHASSDQVAEVPALALGQEVHLIEDVAQQFRKLWHGALAKGRYPRPLPVTPRVGPGRLWSHR